MMKLSQRSLMVGLNLIIFFIVLIGKIDGKSWNWFVVFLPLWAMDLITFLLVYAKRKTDIYNNHFNPIVIYCLIAKILFQLLVCVRLEFYRSIPIYIIMSPFWCLLIMIVCNLFQKILSTCLDLD